MVDKQWAEQITTAMSSQFDALREKHERQCEWFVNEIIMLQDRILELETELMLSSSEFIPGTVNGVPIPQVNIKRKLRSNFK